jgi:hypothetical protein
MYFEGQMAGHVEASFVDLAQVRVQRKCCRPAT